ncbi:FAD-binding protein [Oenococcus sp. UCMA 17063]|nr:FAD-binding protein [Oenococcus sp. UCMA 17063]
MLPKKKQYDLVIVGAGLAGLTAAVSARENCLETLVVEKGRTIGGNGNYVEGAMGVDSYLQKQEHIKIDKVKLLQDELDYSHYEANAPHLKKLINESGQTIDWLHALGIQFLKVGPQGKSWPTIHSFTGGGHEAVKKLYEKATELGAEFALSIGAKKVLMKNGQIIGLLIKNETTGQLREIITSNILLATGGYVDNPELVKKRTPFIDRLLAVSDGKSTGDGMQLAWQAGAQHYQMGSIQYGGGAILDKVMPPYIHITSQLAAASTQEAILWVNEQGNRFVNEDVNDNMCHAGNAILTQSRTFSIFDQQAVNHLINVGLYKEIGNSPISTDKLNHLQEEIDDDLAHHSNYLTKADTINDLSHKLNLTRLEQTVNRYNRLVGMGNDSDFGKDKKYLTSVSNGPFYAVELGVGMSCALGGIRVNNNNEVLNSYGYPLPGLYAAGNDAAGMLVGDTYGVTLPGSTAGYAAFSGRNAVLNISKHK